MFVHFSTNKQKRTIWGDSPVLEAIRKPDSVSDSNLSRPSITLGLMRYSPTEVGVRPCTRVRILPFHLGLVVPIAKQSHNVGMGLV